jgi:hypothetical protein
MLGVEYAVSEDSSKAGKDIEIQKGQPGMDDLNSTLKILGFIF